MLRTAAVREHDNRGRHTTTHRQLVRLPGGALLIDSPGIRKIQLWTADDGLDETFSEIHDLAQDCRFGDCTHHDEPGCAVRGAVENGELEASRLEHLHALQKELRYLALRQDSRAQRVEKKKTAAIHKAAKRFKPRW